MKQCSNLSNYITGDILLSITLSKVIIYLSYIHMAFLPKIPDQTKATVCALLPVAPPHADRNGQCGIPGIECFFRGPSPESGICYRLLVKNRRSREIVDTVVEA